jgi:SAM-dependent methyltransferase
MTAPNNWYESFFQGVALDMWRSYVTPELTRRETDYILNRLQLSAGARVLDVPCGNGRLALELASRGFSSVGVDLAAESIDEGKAEAKRRGLKVDLHHRDMRQLEGLGTFDAVVCWGNSLGYLEESGNTAFLSSVATVLKPGGKLLVDFGTLAETVFSSYQERRWYQVGDILMAIQNHYDVERGRLETDYHFIRDGRQEVRQGSQQVYLFRELSRLLKSVGFADVKVFSYLSDEPLKLGDQRAITVAQR